MSILVKECTSILDITLLTGLPRLLLNDWVLTIVVMHRQGTICRLTFGDHWADDLSELSCPLILHSLNTCLVQTNEPAGAGSWGSFRGYPYFTAYLNHLLYTQPSRGTSCRSFYLSSCDCFWRPAALKPHYRNRAWSCPCLVTAGSPSSEADRKRERGA